MNKRPLLMLCLLFLLGGCHTHKIRELQEKAKILGREMVPDQRTGLWKVTIEKDRGKNVLLRGETTEPAVREALVQVILESGFGCLDSLVLLPDSTCQENPWGLVSVSVANLRKEPSFASEMVSQAVLGTPLRLLKQERGWFFVQSPDRYLSWISAASLQPFDDAGMEAWKGQHRLLFTGICGAVTHEGPDKDKISDLVAGSIVHKTGESAFFYRVELPDRRTGLTASAGWVDFDYWKSDTLRTAEQLVSTAKQFLGLPYLWGGTSSKAFDCSGFTRTLFFLNGLLLERDASQQYRHGTELPSDSLFSALTAGDLLFFGREEPLRIVHVGMYLGDRRVIHSSGWVRINSLDPGAPDFSSYLSGTFVGARRMMGLPPAFGCLPVRDHPWY